MIYDIVLDVDDIVHLLKTHGSPVWCPSLPHLWDLCSEGLVEEVMVALAKGEDVNAQSECLRLAVGNLNFHPSRYALLTVKVARLEVFFQRVKLAR